MFPSLIFNCRLLKVAIYLGAYAAVADHIAVFRKHLSEAESLLTESKPLFSEFNQVNGTENVQSSSANELKKSAENLSNISDTFVADMEKLPEEDRVNVLKSLANPTKEFGKSFRMLVKEVQKSVDESDNNSDIDDIDSCPVPSLMNSTLKGKVDKVKKAIQELKSRTSRRKRATSRKLKIKRALSLIIGLPGHIIFVVACLVAMPFSVVGDRVYITGLFRFISHLAMFIGIMAELAVIPREDKVRFKEAIEKYAAMLRRWGGVKNGRRELWEGFSTL